MLRLFLIFLLCVSFVVLAHTQENIINVSLSQTQVRKPASTKYSNPSLLRLLLTGKNYRKEWSTPVTLPVFQLTKSGLKIKELGGGQQTKSLRLEDRQGREWVLRTVDKDVTKALPKNLQGTIAQKIVQDMVSAAYPYAPLSIPDMARATGVPAANPRFYFVPDDPAFGQYQPLFANQLCMLEEREPVPQGIDTESTEKVVEEANEDNDLQIQQRRVLRARLLDMLIADWDRHADQWRWAELKTRGFTYYYAIPRDRDQAYFYSNGILVFLARQFGLPHLVGFQKNLRKLEKLNHKGWNFDNTFLNDLDGSEWRSTISNFQKALTDDVIDKALKKMPSNIYAISGSTIAEKLRSRRDALLENGMKYYRKLAYHIRISGSDETENFHILQKENNLIVRVYGVKEKKEKLIYERQIDQQETKKITLHGLGGKDHFKIDDNVSSRVTFYIFGGKGKDTHQLDGKVKVKYKEGQMDN